MFFLVLALFDFAIPSLMNSQRLGYARQLSGALAAYRRDHGEFPINAGNSVRALHHDLVEGGYLGHLPAEPFSAWRGIDYFYKSAGPQYGLLIPLQPVELFGRSRNQGFCMIGTDPVVATYWGNLPQCPI